MRLVSASLPQGFALASSTLQGPSRRCLLRPGRVLPDERVDAGGSQSLPGSLLAFAAFLGIRHVQRHSACQGASRTTRIIREASKTHKRGEPTPFPVDEPFEPQMRRFLDLLDEPKPKETELVQALEDLQDLHEFDRQWIIFPRHVDEARGDPYKRGCFKMVRGILKLIDKAPGRVRDAAVDLLLSLSVGGASLTELPVTFLIEIGAVGPLSRAAAEEQGSNENILSILTHLSRSTQRELMPALIDGGAIEEAIKVIHNDTSDPMQQLAALDLIMSFAKRAPMKTAQAGVMDTVKLITNEALVPRRNKIMNYLRPVVECLEDQKAVKAASNIRVGGLKTQ